MRSSLLFFVTSLAALAWPALPADTLPPEADQRLAREIYKEMVESKSGFSSGSTTPIAHAVAARLKAAGFTDADIFVGGARAEKMNVVVRYHGTGAHKPILLLAHTDVVEAKRADWTHRSFRIHRKRRLFLWPRHN